MFTRRTIIFRVKILFVNHYSLRIFAHIFINIIMSRDAKKKN